MKLKPRFGFGLFAGLAVAASSAIDLLGGHPIWPPPKHTREYREANMLFLRFQDALERQRWTEALSYCSDRIRTRAAAAPSLEVFFRQSVPIDLLLAQDFGYWTVRSNFYGLLVPLTEAQSKPFLQWFWAIYATNGGWVIDYPPVKLDEHMARAKAALEERENEIAGIRRDIEPRLSGIETRLIAPQKSFVIGSPMLFRVELRNGGNSAVDYVDSGVAFAPLAVFDEKGTPLPFTETPRQIMVRRGKIAPGETVVLAGKVDLAENYSIREPGKYLVQFTGANLEFGRLVPARSFGSFGESEEEIAGGLDFLGATNRFPSERIKISVTAARKK
jgi:hypothetical protein